MGVLSVMNVRDILAVKGNKEEVVGVKRSGRSMWWLCQISSKTAAICDICAKLLATRLKTYKVWETLSEITESKILECQIVEEVINCFECERHFRC